VVADPAPSTTSVATGNGNIVVGDFGKCTVPQIEFAVGFDNRRETSFQPVDKASYNHGSAQNIDIITQFICDSLVNSCGADQTAKDTCAKAKDAASAAAAKTGAQADAFNSVFGIRTNFANVTPIDDQGRPVGVANTADSGNNPAQTGTTTSIAAAATSSTNNGNLQVFSGALGGVTAPAVTALANGKFQVDGNSAINQKQGALTRSCDVQNNKCADAANASGNKNGFTVAACNAQQKQCVATVNSA